MLFSFNFITLYGVMPCANIKYIDKMKRLLYIVLSALSFGGMSCVPSTGEEVGMYAAPYTEYQPSSRVDLESSNTEIITNEGTEQE